MPRRRRLVRIFRISRGFIGAAALAWASVSTAAEPSIRVSDGASIDAFAAGISRLGDRILSDVSAARDGVGHGQVRYFDLNKPLGDVPGFDDLPPADRVLMRGAKQTYDLFRALGGPRINSFAVTATEDGRYYLSLDGEGGRWLATPGAALTVLARQLAQEQIARLGGGAGGGLPCPLDYRCLLRSLYSGGAPTIATVPRGTTVTLELTGDGFSNEGGLPVIIAPDGITPGEVNFVGPDQINAPFSIAPDAPTGLQPVLVFNPNQQFSGKPYWVLVVKALKALETSASGETGDGGDAKPGTGKVDPIVDDFAGTIAKATLLESNLSGKIEVSGDTDMFRIDLETNGVLTISSDGPSDLVGELMNADGEIIARNDDGGWRYNIMLETPLNRGTFYLSIQHCCNGRGSYTLNRSFLAN